MQVKAKLCLLLGLTVLAAGWGKQLAVRRKNFSVAQGENFIRDKFLFKFAFSILLIPPLHPCQVLQPQIIC
jgi:hypothetical protein